MTRSIMATVSLFILTALSGPAAGSEAVGAVVEAAQADCQSFENGVLETDPHRTISLADLTGDKRLEEIVDGNQFICPTARSLFCGTSGCQLTVVVGEQPFEFLGKAWKVAKQPDGKPVLKLAVHWSLCNYQNSCWESYIWNGSAFDSLGSKAE